MAGMMDLQKIHTQILLNELLNEVNHQEKSREFMQPAHYITSR